MKYILIICLILFITLTFAGCSSDEWEDEFIKSSVGQSTGIKGTNIEEVEDVNPYNYMDLTSLPQEYTFDMAKENGDVAWTNKEVYNLYRLDKFIRNVNNGLKDMVRVVGFTKEGDPIVKDLKYDGEMINLSRDSTRDRFSANPGIRTYKYRQIFVENRYDKHYNGNFTEYILKNNRKDNGILILQLFEGSS